MHHQIQAKLLRAIENKSFRRLGGHKDIHVDVRIIAATNRDIPDALSSGVLRKDLYYRLSVVEIELPPLRDRKEDIPILASHFLDVLSKKYGKPAKRFSPESMELLMAYKWPGNVREMKNIVESIVLMCPLVKIEPSVLPLKISLATPQAESVCVPLGVTLEEAERLYILQTLEMTGKNKSEAARILGLSRKSLYDRLNRHFRSGAAAKAGQRR
jgi:DNA-binding NtrC family response regulator